MSRITLITIYLDDYIVVDEKTFIPEVEQGDPDFLAALVDIEALHKRKSARYGTDEDRFDNFTRVAQSRDQDPGVYIIDRIQEKLVRIQNMQKHGDTIEEEDWLDIASCALCGEAMRRKTEKPQ